MYSKKLGPFQEEQLSARDDKRKLARRWWLIQLSVWFFQALCVRALNEGGGAYTDLFFFRSTDFLIFQNTFWYYQPPPEPQCISQLQLRRTWCALFHNRPSAKTLQRIRILESDPLSSWTLHRTYVVEKLTIVS